MKSQKQNEQIKQIYLHRYREQSDGCQMGEGWGISENNEGIKYKQEVKNSHGNVKYSIGNTVNDVVITLYGARWVLELSGR